MNPVYWVLLYFLVGLVLGLGFVRWGRIANNDEAWCFMTCLAFWPIWLIVWAIMGTAQAFDAIIARNRRSFRDTLVKVARYGKRG